MNFDFQTKIVSTEDCFNKANSVDKLWESYSSKGFDSLKRIVFIEAKIPKYSISNELKIELFNKSWGIFKAVKPRLVLEYPDVNSINIITPDEFDKLTKFESFYSKKLEFGYLHEITHKYLKAQITETEFESFLNNLTELEKNEVNLEIRRIVHLYYVWNSLEKLFKTLLKAKNKLLREIVTSFKNQKIISGKIKILFAPYKIVPNSLRPIKVAA